MCLELNWRPELTSGIFVIAGAVIALGGVLISQWQATHRDRAADARQLRDSKRQRLESAYLPVLSSANAMWDLVLRQGKRPEEVDSEEERDDLLRLWQRVSNDVDDSLVKLSLESDAAAASAKDLYSGIRSEFFAHLQQRTQAANGQDPTLNEQAIQSRKAVRAKLEELETLAKQQLNTLSEPIRNDRHQT